MATPRPHALHFGIGKNGEATLANAGHLAPYLNGESVAMEGALPLGLMEGAEFSVMDFQLNEGDKLVLMSDGIAEAMDERGQLFGFERVHALLRTATTASEVAKRRAILRPGRRHQCHFSDSDTGARACNGLSRFGPIGCNACITAYSEITS